MHKLSLVNLLIGFLLNVSLIQAADTYKSPLSINAVAEIGFVSVLSHTIQFGNNGTLFDYVKNGGQDVLFPVQRLSLECKFQDKNTIILLYQPLSLETTDLLKRNLIVDNMLFPANTSVKFLYSFPFYRISYLRSLTLLSKKWNLSLGATLQIRNATISFESTDGSRFRTNRDVGLVPALKTRASFAITDLTSLGFEADGIYAPISYLNGNTNEVKGAILDASVSLRHAIANHNALYFTTRYLGGGATGTSTKDTWPGDGYVKNWLHFLFAATGFVYTF